MSKRVRAVQHGRRRRAKPAQRSPSGKEVSYERFAARNQLIREHVPRSSLETAEAKELADLRRALGAHFQVVVDDDRLSIEQEALVATRRTVEQIVDQGDKTLLKPLERMVPLSVPVRVRDDVCVERHRAGKR